MIQIVSSYLTSLLLALHLYLPVTEINLKEFPGDRLVITVTCGTGYECASIAMAKSKGEYVVLIESDSGRDYLVNSDFDKLISELDRRKKQRLGLKE